MSFRKKKSMPFELNVIPLVDVVLVLLIFFMLTTNFNKLTQVSLVLPKVDNGISAELQQGIEIKITARGEYFINDTPVINADKRMLMNAITRMAGENRDLPFIISGDGKAPHQAIVTALDVAGELGFSKVRINSTKIS